jgi:hypothetical protein
MKIVFDALDVCQLVQQWAQDLLGLTAEQIETTDWLALKGDICRLEVTVRLKPGARPDSPYRTKP